MKKLATLAVLGSATFALAACGSTDDASTEAMPDTVEMPADVALEPLADDLVDDTDAGGPLVDPAATAPDPATTEEVADDAAQVATEAMAAIVAAEAAEAAEDPGN